MSKRHNFFLSLKLGVIFVMISITFTCGTLDLRGVFSEDNSIYQPLTDYHYRISPSVKVNVTNTLIWNLTGHTNEVWSVAIHPDKEILASASSDNLIKLWNISNGQLIRDLHGHVGSVYSLAFDPEGKILASSSYDTNVLLWNITNGEMLTNYSEHSAAVWCVDFSPDGKILASGSNDNSIKLWNISNHQLIHNLTGHNARVRTLAFSPDGHTLASGSYDNSIKLWNVSTGILVKDLINHSDYVVSVDFSPDGENLISGSYDQLINVWDIETGDVSKILVGHTNFVRAVAMSPDGEVIASGSYDGGIKFWDTEKGELIGNLSAHTTTILDLNFDSFGLKLASCSSDRSIKLWNITDIDSDDLPDNWERLYNLNPGDFGDRTDDPDDDNLINIIEYEYGTNPRNSDTDGDLLPDGYEYNNNLNGNVDDAALDLDQDGMPNLYEYENGLLVGTDDAVVDSDGDGIPNLYEYQNGLLAGSDDDANDDLDSDGLPNLYEYQNNLLIGVDDASEDPDDDGLSNLVEYSIGTDPRDSDSDNDDWSDGIERQWGTNPNDPNMNPAVLIILILIGIIILGVGSFTSVKYGPQILKYIFPQPETSWAQDLQMGKAIPIDLLTEIFEKTSLDIPRTIKNELPQQQLIGKSVVMRSQMVLLKPIPPQDVNCQVCMSQIVETHYFQCSQCQRYVCINDYVDLQGVGRSSCPNCSGDLLIFPFSCSACELDYSSINELSKQARCPLCGYTLPDQATLISKIIQGMSPSQMIQDLSKESREQTNSSKEDMKKIKE
ncbi:MAG: hypothetical protein ACFFDC_14085 [Promethearchaeota archaeon]